MVKHRQRRLVSRRIQSIEIARGATSSTPSAARAPARLGDVRLAVFRRRTALAMPASCDRAPAKYLAGELPRQVEVVFYPRARCRRTVGWRRRRGAGPNDVGILRESSL